MGKEEKVVDDQKVVTEEVVETTESEDSPPETEVDNISVASVEEETPSVDETDQEEPEATPSEKSSLDKEEEVPFNKNPKFQERVAEIETKYGKKAQMWDTLAKLSTNDPSFQLDLTKRLEAAGELPKGTYELAKKRYDSPEEKKPDELSEKVSSLPELQYVRKLIKDDKDEKAAEDREIEEHLQAFEGKHPDVASSLKPMVLRTRIATLSDGYREEGMSYEGSLEEAYNVLFNRENMLAEAREKGEIEGQIKSDIKSVASTPTTSKKAKGSKNRKLTREEEEARAVLGYSKGEYIKFKDSDGFVE